MGKDSGIRAGRAFVEVGMKDKLTGALNKLKKRFKNFGKSLGSIGAKFAAFGGASLSAFTPAILAASNLEEVMNKFNVVFGDNAEAVKAWGDEFAGQVGRSKRQIAEFLAENQDLFVPLGFDPQAATELSKQVTKMSIDLASFNNLNDADVLRDFKAALTGSGEVMKKYGVILSEAAVKQELLDQAIDPKSATNQQKVQARLNIITRGTTAAMGDATRSAGSFANQKKRLTGIIEDAAGAIGGALLPVITPLITKLGDAAKIVAEWVTANKPVVVMVLGIVAAVTAAGVALIGLGGAFALLSSAIGAAMAVFGTMAAIVGAILSPIGLVIAGVIGLGAIIVQQTDIARDAMGFLGETFSGLKSRATEAFGGIRDALAGGDINLAAKILWLALKQEWLKGTLFIREKTLGIRDAFGTALSGVETAWVHTVGFLQDAWGLFVNFVQKSWRTATGFIAKALLPVLKLFDSTIDIDAASKAIDEQTQQKNVAGDTQLDKDISKREADRKANLDQIQKEKQARREANLQAIEDNKKQIDAAKQQFTDLRKQAAVKAVDAAKKKAGGTPAAGGGGGGLAQNVTAAAARVVGPTDVLSKEGIEKILAATQGTGGETAADKSARLAKELLEFEKKNQGQQLKMLNSIAANTKTQLQPSVLGGP